MSGVVVAVLLAGLAGVAGFAGFAGFAGVLVLPARGGGAPALGGAGASRCRWSFSLATPVGFGLVALGLAVGWVGLWRIERIARGVTA